MTGVQTCALPISAQGMVRAGRSQQPVEGGGADLAQGFLLARGELAVVALIVRQPKRQGRSQAFAAGLFGRQPDDRLEKPSS